MDAYKYTTKTHQTAKDSCARTWQIDRGVSQAVNTCADELECYPSDLVNFLLQRALSAVESGEWRIDRTPIKYSLHWGQGASNENQEGIKSDRTEA